MKTMDLFNNLIQYYKTGDESYLTAVNNSSKDSLVSIANDSYNTVSKLVQSNVILPIFLNDDTSKIFESLVEVFAAVRVINILRKAITNPFIIPEEAVQDYLASYGFDIYYLFDDFTQRTILAELFNLYKQTGTIEGVASVVKLLGYPTVKIFEHWLERKVSGELNITAKLVYGTKTGPGPQFSLNDPLITNDPLWRLTAPDIDTLEATSNFKLPSKTSYFSVVGEYNLFETDVQFATIVEKIVEYELNQQQVNGYVERSLNLDFYGDNVTFTEAVLAYTFLAEQPFPQGQTFDPTVIPEKVLIGKEPKYTHDGIIQNYYTDSKTTDFDNTVDYPLYDERNLTYDDVKKLAYVPEIVNRDDIVPTITEDYKRIVDSIFSATYSERQARLDEYKQTFVKPGYYTIVDNKTNKASIKLRELNKEFYIFIADGIMNEKGKEYLEAIYKNIQTYVMMVSGTILPSGISFDGNKVKQAVGFIKPYRARPLVIAASYVMKDPFDTLLIKDKVMSKGFMRFTCPYQYDFGHRFDKWLFDSGKNNNDFIKHDTIYGFDGLPYSIRYDDIDRIIGSLLSFDSSFYFDQMKTFDYKRRNSNICNLFEFSDILKAAAYISIRSNNYTPEQYLEGNEYEFNSLDKIVKSLTIRKTQIEANYAVAIEAEYETEEEQAAAIKAQELLEQKLNLVTRQLAYYSSLPKYKITPATTTGLDNEDKFEFTDTVFETSQLDATYDNGCVFDVPGFDTFDEDTYTLREAL